MTPLSKGLGILFGIPLLLSAIFFYYFTATGEERMRATCAQVAQGMTFEQLAVFAREHNLSAPANNSPTVLLTEQRNFGGHSCKVEFQSGTVANATYHREN